MKLDPLVWQSFRLIATIEVSLFAAVCVLYVIIANKPMKLRSVLYVAVPTIIILLSPIAALLSIRFGYFYKSGFYLFIAGIIIWLISMKLDKINRTAFIFASFPFSIAACFVFIAVTIFGSGM